MAILLGVSLLAYSNSKKDTIQVTTPEKSTYIKNIFPVDHIEKGIIYDTKGCYLVAELEGINISAMPEVEQNGREAALIDIFLRLDYPIRFITNTTVVDTSAEANHIAGMADTPNENLKAYRILYAGALQQMRVERSVLTQQTIIVVPGSTAEEANQRLKILASALNEQTSIKIIPLTTTEAVFDMLQDIITPEKIIKPSQVAAAGVLEPIHFSAKEAVSFAQDYAGTR